jgi:hypothetical protein
MIVFAVLFIVMCGILAVLGFMKTRSGASGPYGEDLPEYLSFEAIKLDKQKALAGNSMNYLFDQQVSPKTQECKIPLPAPVGRKFR